MAISCGDFQLRPWQAGDEPALVRHANDHEISLNLRDRFPHPYTREDAENWIELTRGVTPPTTFAINVGGEAVGGVGLELHKDIERLSAELGYWLGRAFWGRGIMSKAVSAATRYGFEDLGLARIYAVPFVRNSASCRVLEKNGYIREAVMRRSAIKDGVILDQALYAITDLDRGNI